MGRVSAETAATKTIASSRPYVGAQNCPCRCCSLNRMNYTQLRIQRLTRELCEEMSLEYGTEQAARMFEQAANDIRTATGARSTRPADRAFTFVRSALTGTPHSAASAPKSAPGRVTTFAHSIDDDHELASGSRA